MSDLSGRTTVVVGASRGLGRGRPRVRRGWCSGGRGRPHRPGPCRAGHHQRHHPAPRSRMRPRRRWRGACWTSISRRFILVAGANPVMGPLQDQTWETFSVNWHTDVKITFTWLRAALLRRCRRAAGWWWSAAALPSTAHRPAADTPGPRPPSGSSRATPRRSRAAGLDLTVTAVLPTMTPFGEVGRRGFGHTRPAAARPRRPTAAAGELLTPEGRIGPGGPGTGRRGDHGPGYLLTAAGLQKLP